MRRTTVVLAGLLCIVMGCSSLPKVTRTGAVKDIVVADQLTPTELTANAGDEIRWINKRNGPIRVVFLDPINDKFSCNNGFGGLTVKSNSASLDPNESASVCFKNPGYYRYTVRMESASSKGELNAPGAIRVGDMGS